MPIYEYECEAGGPFEVMQRISEEPLKACEKCGRPVHRLMSLSSFALVGGGWYKDLYGSTNNGKSASSSASKDGESKPAPAKTETKAESKPASTASPAAA